MSAISMKLQYLAYSQLNNVLTACRTLEAEYATTDAGVVERAASSSSETYEAARTKLSAALQAVPDPAMIELQALAWTGRGDLDASLAENLEYSKARFDSTSRDYLASKSPLRQYIENCLKSSGVVLVD
jgi:hypothetical protein